MECLLIPLIWGFLKSKKEEADGQQSQNAHI